MTCEQFAQKQAEVPTEKLIETARNWVSILCKTGGDGWTLRVPPSINCPDMVFTEVIRRLELLTSSNSLGEKLAAEIAEMPDFEFENSLNELKNDIKLPL